MRKFICILCCFTFPVLAYSVDDPTGFAALPVSDSQINLSWNLNSNNDSVLIVFNSTNNFGIPTNGTFYSVSDTISGGGIVINKGINLLFSHTGLLPNTTYYYKIWSFTSGNIFSLGNIDSAKTFCIHEHSPYYEYFEHNGNMPDCWTQENLIGNLNWIVHDGNPYFSGSANLPAHAFDSSYCAFFGSNSSSNNGNKTKLIMPPFEFTPSNLGSLSFWACIPSNDTLNVYYKTSFNGIWILLSTISNVNGNWVNCKVVLPNPSSDYYIAFEGIKSSTLNSGICIDDIAVCKDACCPGPNSYPINGSASTCIGFNDQYSVTNSLNTNYYWSYSNSSYSSGQLLGTNIFSPSFTSIGIWKVCVTPEDTCTFGLTKCTTVCVSAGEMITGNISGSTNPCIGSIQTYTITPTPSSTQCSFNWSVPLGWTINSGNGTFQINVTVGSSNGSVSFVPLCGYCATLCPGWGLSKTVSPITIPAQPSIITGTTFPCQNSSQTYSVTNVTGVIYTWVVPSGWTITSGQNTNTIHLTVGSTNGTITVTPSNSCGIGTSRTLAVSSNLLPLQPSLITGNITPCYGTSQIYSVIEVTGVSYNWSFPAGWTQASGTTTDSVTVNTGLNSGNITVTPSNLCGNGLSTTLSVSALNVPSQPSPITGELNPCSGFNQTYSIINVSGVSYTWSFPTNWNQTGGGNTNEVSVLTTTDIGNITVIPSNTCGNGSAQSISVSPSVGLPLNVTLSGDTFPCIGTAQNYSVANETGVSFTWQIPVGWTQTSGGNSNSISVLTDSNFGFIVVTPSNNCGNGNADSIYVSVKPLPDQPSPIIGSINPCVGSTQIYNVNEAIDVNYNWSFPSDWIISGGSNSDSITFIIGNNSGNITLTPYNSCGSGNIQQLWVSTVPIVTSDVSISALPGTDFCTGTPITLVATPINEGVNPVYEWYVDGLMVGNSLNYILSTPISGSSIYFIMQSDNNCAALNPVSSDTIVIYVHSFPSPPLITVNADTLKSNYVDGNQWYYNNQPISVEINSECPIIGEGSYYVVYTDQYGCSSTSETILITGNLETFISEFKMFPNPTSSNFVIECNLPANKSGTIKAFNSEGIIFSEYKLEPGINRINVPASKWSSQVIFCGVFIEDRQVLLGKVVKE